MPMTETQIPPEVDASRASAPVLTLRSLRMMHLLERIAARFNKAGVPLMALKGAALNLTLYDRPDARPMADLDLMIRPEDVDQAFALLEELGGLRGEALVREDFFPRFHYEVEYTLGTIYPVKIDLHIRPFRSLRYAQSVPTNALWARAETVSMGRANVLIPSTEDMLLHLTVHAAIHGCARRMWLEDIRLWIEARKERIDWDEFLATVEQWRLALPVRQGLVRIEHDYGLVCPGEVTQSLLQKRVGWRDRLALWQAPRDAGHPAAHVVVNALCIPGLRFTFGYLRALLFPDKAHMADWYSRRHWGWLPCAHLLRWLGPIVSRLPRLQWLISKTEVRPSPVHGIGVFASRDIGRGEVVARYHGKNVEHDGIYVVWRMDASGHKQRYEITGKLKFLNHSCRPNAQLSGFALLALRPIRAGEEITIKYEGATCTCREQHQEHVVDRPIPSALAG